MCMLTYFPAGVLPDAEALINGAEYNDDGHGYAIVAGRRLIIRHSLNGKELVERFVRERAKHRNGPALFHSRIGTAGPNDITNCHPFRIKGDKRTVIAHNGILPTAAQPWKGDKRNDTRVFADEFLPLVDPAQWANPSAIKRVEDWLGHNKILLLSVNPDYPVQTVLLNEDLGYWDGGIWYSNHDYLGGAHHLYAAYGSGLSRSYVAGSSLSADDYAAWSHRAAWGLDDDVDEFGESRILGHTRPSPYLHNVKCLSCGYETIDVDTGICEVCDHCNDCGEHKETCFCYIPAGTNREDVRGLNPDTCDDAPWWTKSDTPLARAVAATEDQSAPLAIEAGKGVDNA